MSYIGQLYFPCKQSQFTIVNETIHTTAVFTDTQRGVNIYKANNGNAEGLATMLQAVASTPYTVIAHLAWNAFNFNGTGGFSDPGPQEARMGICFTNGTSTSSKLRNLTVGNLNGSASVNTSGGGTTPVSLFGVGIARQYSNYNTTNGGDAIEQHCPATFGAKDVWLKLHNDGANATYWCSENGIQWFQLYSEGANTYFTPTYAGIVCSSWGSDANFNIKSFQLLNN